MTVNRPLRIMFVAPFGLRHKTTVWARTLPLARELNRQGHFSSILIPPWDSPQDSGILVIRDGVRLEHVELVGGLPAISMRLLQRVLTDTPDIVHIVKPRAYAGIVQWLLWKARSAGVLSARLLLDVDDWEKPWSRISQYPPHQARFLAWQEEWGIRHTDGITAASRWLDRRAQAITPSTPRLYLPNGVERVNERPGQSYALRQPPRILLLSRFMEVNPTWLGEMWQALQQQVPDSVLIVAGRALHIGGELPYLRALAEKSSAGASKGSPVNVIWRGYVNPRDLSELYDSVDCVIFPSDDSPLHRAKCSVRMATALQHSVPVVASAVGEQAAYGDDGAACLVSADASPNVFAGAVVDVLRQRDQRESLGRSAAKRLNEHYLWRTLGESLAHFYAEVLQHK
jgi:glycosyltransferase involved in cell wall biosynthesis